MGNIIAVMNMTLDGICDHTAGIADDEMHEHYNQLLGKAEALVYGRITYQLMESSWPAIVKNPTGNKSTDDFAVIIDNVLKLVFSHTLKSVEWRNTRLATKGFKEEMLALKEQVGGDILIGSPSVIVTALNMGLLDEFQLNVQPTIAAAGLPLFKNITDRINLKLLKTKTLSSSGSVIFYYKPENKR
jgi:dihydrofolate reductase